MLDHRIVEVGVGLPASLTLGKKGKAVLRALHERRFGRELARRRKQGFGVPVERWLRGPLRPVCAELFSKRRLDEQGLLSSHELGDGAWMRWADTDPQILWHAFALAAWCEAETDPERLRELFEGRASSRASKPEVHATIS
jgi:asparagine synthase (glutamine-hydrolysing)